jgi:hypothetical protein
MTFALIGLAFFVGGFFGLLAGCLAAAAKKNDDYWDAFAEGYRSGFDHPELSLN